MAYASSPRPCPDPRWPLSMARSSRTSAAPSQRPQPIQRAQNTRRKKRLECSPEPEPSASTLLNHSQETTEEWFRSARTTKAYANYVKGGISWLERWVKEPTAENDRGEFIGAFNSISAQTPITLRLLLAYKCDHEGKGFATAEGLRSAFKQYFER